MPDLYDVLVIGGGPAGSIAALCLARAGKNVLIIEKAQHPRFHIGESFLPYGFQLLKELDLVPRLRAIPHVPKFGAEFGFGNDENTQKFSFTQSLGLKDPETFNVERAVFDQMLLGAATDAGAKLLQAGVRDVVQLQDGDVRLRLDDGAELRGRYLLDASGQQTVVGRHLGTKQHFVDPHLQKVAYFSHLTGVWRHPGVMAGYPCILMCEEGWFWIIPLNETVTSVGIVIDRELAKQTGVPPTQMLAWAIPRCPVLRERCRDAAVPPSNHILSNFSYTCRPYAGDGHFLIGDAAAFLDPIFSTGGTLAMASARHAAGLVNDVLDGKRTPDSARKRHITFFTDSAKPFWDMIRGYYRHSFRELFMNGTGPMKLHNAALGVLAGNVFPRPSFPLAWRLKVLHTCVRLNEWKPLVPRRPHFSLLAEPPQAMPNLPPVTAAAPA